MRSHLKCSVDPVLDTAVFYCTTGVWKGTNASLSSIKTTAPFFGYFFLVCLGFFCVLFLFVVFVFYHFFLQLIPTEQNMILTRNLTYLHTIKIVLSEWDSIHGNGILALYGAVSDHFWGIKKTIVFNKGSIFFCANHTRYKFQVGSSVLLLEKITWKSCTASYIPPSPLPKSTSPAPPTKIQ